METHRPPRRPKFVNNWPRASRWILVVALVIGIFGTGIAFERYQVGKSIKSALRWVRIRVTNSDKIAKSLTVQPDELRLDIPFKNFRRLRKIRSEALGRGILIAKPNHFVGGKITLNGDSPIKIKLRLKGDYLDHLRTDRWSMRIKVSGDSTLYGMKRFSLQKPHTRNHLNEWVYHRALKDENLIGLRYRFVRLHLNGEDWGIYALEEHFGKRLIESNRRRAGVLLKFGEDHLWFRYWKTGRMDLAENFWGSPVETFQTRSVQSNPILRKEAEVGRSLLEGFRNQTLGVSEVFNTDRLATYLALNALLGASHATYWNNIRFYFNPVSQKLEPVGFDALAGDPLPIPFDKILNPKKKDFVSLFFRDRKFVAKYFSELSRVSGPHYLDQFFGRHGDQLKENANILVQDDPSYEFKTDIFYSNRNRLQKILKTPRAVMAYLDQQQVGRVSLSLRNIQSIPIEVLGTWSKNSLKPFDGGTVLLVGKRKGEPAKFTRVTGAFGEEVVYRVLGIEKQHRVKIQSWPAPQVKSRQKSHLARYPFVRVRSKDKVITLRRGKFRLQGTLRIPAGHQVVAQPGFELTLANQARFLSHSPVTWKGTKESRVRFVGEKGNGGVLIQSRGKLNVLEFVEFEGLNVPGEKHAGLTGGLTFFHSPVIGKDVSIKNGQAEDSINLVHSPFEIERLRIDGSASDAFDSDFSDGLIQDSQFLRQVNDGLDFSGSRIRLKQVQVTDAGDKAISTGERSEVQGDKIRIEKAKIGLAAKDDSSVMMTNVSLIQAELDFAVFQKKSEFGPARMEIHDFKINGKMEHLVEAGSVLNLGGKIITGNQRFAKKMLYEKP